MGWTIIAAICWALWAVVQKLAIRNMSPMLVNLTNAYVYSAFAPLMYLLMKARDDRFDWSTRGICWTILGSTLATAGAYAYLFALEKQDAGRVVAGTAGYPALTFLLCAVFLNETVTLTRFVGIVVVCVGVYMTTR